MLFLEILIFREFIFGDLHFIFKDLGSDSYVNEYPLLYNRMLAAKEGFLPGWSLHNGLGENLYPYSFEPISWFLFKITSVSPETMMLILPLVYIYLAGLFMFLFLNEHRLYFYAKIFGSLAWAFSGYFLLSASWSVTLFSPVAFHFAILLFALEKAFSQKKYFWLSLVFFLIGVSYPLNLYFSLIIFCVYFLIINYLKNNSLKLVYKEFLYSVLYTILGIGLSSWMLFSSIDLMFQSPRGSGSVSSFEKSSDILVSKGEFLSFVYRIFSPNILGDVNHFTEYRNYFEAPFLYCSIFTLILLSQISILNKKAKIISLYAILGMVLIFIFPVLRQLIWINSGDYYRILNSFFALILILISSFIFSKILSQNKFSLKPLLIFCVLMIFILILGYLNLKIETQSSFLIPIFFIIIYVLAFLFKDKFSTKNFGIILIIFLGIELLLSSSQILSKREICNFNDIENKGYKDSSFKTISEINKNDPSFFRLEKDFYSGVSVYASYNEAKIQNYNSSAAYNSFNNNNYINFLKLFDVIKPNNEIESRFVKGIEDSPILMKLCSVKYFLSAKNKGDYLQPLGFSEVDDNGIFKTLKDSKFLPFGVCFDSVLGINEFKNLTKNQKEEFSLKTLIVDNEDLNQFKNYVYDHKQTKFNEDLENRKENYLNLSKFSDNNFSGNINLPKNQFLFLSMPFDKGWEAKDNGKPVILKKAFGGLTFLFLEKGNHKIEFKFSPSYKKSGISISLISAFLLIILIFFHKRNNLRQIK